MKRTALRRKTPLQRGGKLRVAGISDTAETKRNIQALLRDIVMKRDGKCILSSVRCGRTLTNCETVWQADHLVSRGNSATYADSRLVVLICRPCHGWKSLGSNLRKAQYDEIVRSLLPKDRVELWDRCERDSWRPVPARAADWKLAELSLKQELSAFST